MGWLDRGDGIKTPTGLGALYTAKELLARDVKIIHK